jgi:hypothetical protein
VSDERPIVGIDVDGVVNLGRFLSSAKRGKLRGDQGWYQGWYGDRAYGDRLVVNRAWGPMLRSLADEGAELCWGSTWGPHANWCIGPLLGLPELRYAPCEDDRKAVPFVAFTMGRPWAWLEDIEDNLLLASALSPSRPHCPVLVDRKTGLTEGNAETVRTWLKSL